MPEVEATGDFAAYFMQAEMDVSQTAERQAEVAAQGVSAERQAEMDAAALAAALDVNPSSASAGEEGYVAAQRQGGFAPIDATVLLAAAEAIVARSAVEGALPLLSGMELLQLQVAFRVMSQNPHVYPLLQQQQQSDIDFPLSFAICEATVMQQHEQGAGSTVGAAGEGRGLARHQLNMPHASLSIL